MSTRTRLRYSLSTLSLQLDTTTVINAPWRNDNKKQPNSLRTRRNVSIFPKLSKDNIEERPEIEAAHDALGVDVAGWAEGEVEAIQRLWNLRPEWKGYM